LLSLSRISPIKTAQLLEIAMSFLLLNTGPNKHVSDSDPAGADLLKKLIQSHCPSWCTPLGTSWATQHNHLTSFKWFHQAISRRSISS
jgi:hypothetical protein